jgi:hypothetical protein
MKFRIYAALLLLAVSLGGCKKWLDINSDPANPQIGTAEVLLPPIQFQMANNVANDYRFLFKYIQNWGAQAANNIYDMHGYEAASDNAGSIWRMVYVNLGLNLEQMIKDAQENGKWTYAGIGYAIKAWAFQIATDYHGPIILDQAFDTTRLFFNYQDQPEVYEKVREWAHTALYCLDQEDALDYTAVLAGATGDQIYKGDRVKWRKFVHALLALQFSHLRNKSGYLEEYADSVIHHADLAFSSAADDATVFFNASNTAESNLFGVSQGLISSTVTANINMGRIGQPIVSLLTGGVRGTPATNPKTSLDPRLSRMINYSPSDSVYRGVTLTQGDPATTKRVPHVLGSVAAPYPGKYLFADKARFPIMSYSQVQFAKAEALFVQGLTTEAHAAYLNGINGHMEFVNLYGRIAGTGTAPAITTAEITAYTTSSEVAQTGAELTIADIMSQKYIAQWGWAGLEQWNDLRKYHYDTAVFKNLFHYELENIYASNQGKLAYRVRPRYNSEYIWNREELAKWGGLDEDYNTKELWFSLP